MSDDESNPLIANPHDVAELDPVPAARKRPKPGERRTQILQALAAMLEKPGADRITTASLAAHLEVSEAALYRHFASKAQMFEGLIDFIEQSVFTLIHQIAERESSTSSGTSSSEAGDRQAGQIVRVVMQFAEKNPGMVRVMVGDALVLENQRLQQRINLFFDKLESTLKQLFQSVSAQNGSLTPTVDATVQASVVVAFLNGRLQRFARSGFKRLPSEYLDESLALLI
ncbi:MAG: nucleoid occlusion factor SlmA [Rhodoferax sp.]|nr:nucleoid occlusion factor SlmA [Rhodoferax sp.]MBP7491937.1 nucleoid occlusion factor SlmA [Rhodoferax sp.]